VFLCAYRQENEQFRFAVGGLEMAGECQRLPLSSFLLLPMHRITRMPLLFSAVCQRHETTADCPPEITRCLSILQKVYRVLFCRIEMFVPSVL